MESCDSSEDDEQRRGDRSRPRRADRRALAAVAGIRADALRAGTDARRTVGGLGWSQRRVAGDAYEQQPHPDGLQRPRARDRPRLPVKPRHSRLLESLRRDIRPYVAHPIRHPRRTHHTRPGRMARASRRSRRALRPGRGGQRQVSRPRHPNCARARHVRRLGTSHLHVPVQGARPVSRQARSGGGLRDQRVGDRRRTRPARRRTRGPDPAAAALRPAEVRRGSPVGSPDLHAIRSLGQRDPAGGRDRPPAQGDRGRGRREARSSTAHRRPTRRSSRPGSPSTRSTCRWWPRAESRCARG